MAIELVAGEPLRTYVTYLYPDMTPITGATFTVISALRSDGTSFATDVTFTEQPNGVYTVYAPTSVDDVPGEWHLVVEGDADLTRFSEIFDVQSTRRPVTIQQNIYVSGHSRQDIRRRVARELGDIYVVTATQASIESQIIDEYNLALENRHYDGMDVRCTIAAHADNVGKFATVSVSSQESRSVTVIPPFPAEIHAGDEFELTNKRGMGWRGVDYDNAINAAIRKAGDEHYWMPASITLEDPFDRSLGTIEIPYQFSYFHGVSYSDRRGRRQVLPPSHFTIDRYSHTIHVKDRHGYPLHGREITLNGAIEPPPLEADDHKTPIPLDWLMTEVKAILLNADVAQGATQGRDRLFYMDRQGADARRTLIIKSVPPNTVKLR